MHDVVSSYTHIGLGDSQRLLIAKLIPGLKERIAVLELDPRQHMSDTYAQELIDAGTLPKGNFYTVRAAGLRSAGWTMRRGMEVLPRETPEPVVSQGLSSPEARGREEIIAAASAAGKATDPGSMVGHRVAQRDGGRIFNVSSVTPDGRRIILKDGARRAVERSRDAVIGRIIVSNYDPRPVIGTVAPERLTTEPARRASADASVGKPQSFTDAGLRAIEAEHGVDPKSGGFEQLGDVQRLQQAGRLTKAEQDALKNADAEVKRAEDYAKALDATARDPEKP